MKSIEEQINSLTLEETIALAKGTTDVDILAKLSSYPNMLVRWGVIENENTPLSVLEKMQRQEHDWRMVWPVENEIDKRNKTYVKRYLTSGSAYDDAYPTRTTVWDDDPYPPYR